MASRKQEMALDYADQLAMVLLEGFSSDTLQIEAAVCGSIRRRKKVVGDIDLAVQANIGFASGVIWETARHFGLPCELLSNLKSVKKTCDFLIDGQQVNVYSSDRESWGAMLLFLTGNAWFNVALRAKAKSFGFKLNQYGLWHGSTVIAGRCEAQIFECIGLPYLRPEERDFSHERKKWPVGY